MLTDRNNVFGMIKASHGLKPILRAIAGLVADGGRAAISRSGFDGATKVRMTTDAADFESTPLGGGEHLLNGGVGGSIDEVLEFVRALSGALSEARVEHRFEVYDNDNQLVQIIPLPTGEHEQ